jgi:hypothetical protein
MSASITMSFLASWHNDRVVQFRYTMLPMLHKIRRVEELIHSDCYVTEGLCYNLSTCKGSVIAVTVETGY